MMPKTKHSKPIYLSIDSAPWQQWHAVSFRNLSSCIILLLAASVILRSWIFTALIPNGLIVTQIIHYGGIFIVPLYLLFCGKLRLNFHVLLMVIVFSFGSFLAIYQEESLIKWFSLAATITAVGPMIKSQTAVRVRIIIWKVVAIGVVLTAVASLMWVLFPLPRIEYGLFSGISIHPKTMALDASLAVCIIAAWMTRNKARFMAPLAIISIAMVIMSGSRASVIAVLASLMMIFLIRGVKYLPLITILMTLTVSILYLGPIDSFFESKTGNYYTDKGLSNTREHLWRLRLSEIEKYPFFGVGVGMADQILKRPSQNEISSGIAFIDENGRVRIEPGSSWLSVFSMTGIFGGILFIIVFIHAIKRLYSRRRQIDNRKYAELMAIAVSFSLHMVEGGFVLSFGNPHSFVFWLWLGHLYDCSNLATSNPNSKKSL